MAERFRKFIKAVARRTAASVLQQYEVVREPFQSVLILGHMRSGSTLLHHILISHQDLIGCGERNTVYESPNDLALLRLQSQHRQRLWLRFPRYAVDQINHNKFTPNPKLLSAPQVRCVFLLREPLGSISSLMRVLAPLYGFGLKEAIQHYVERLAGLKRLATGLANTNRTAFLTYGDLVHETTATLSGLSRFLELDDGLNEAYASFEFTGTRGDPGEKIHLNRISTESSEPIELPAAETEQLEAAYGECLRTLSELHPRLCLTKRQQPAAQKAPGTKPGAY